jgi:hypothetical protein
MDTHIATCLNCDGYGYVASALVLATFSMRSMRALRVTAIASNVAFILYATLAHLQPILILHGLLLPLNCARLLQGWFPLQRIYWYATFQWVRSAGLSSLR